METTIDFRKEWLDNNPDFINNSDRETMLMKAYALQYHQTKVKDLTLLRVSKSF